MWEWAVKEYAAATPQVQGAVIGGLITAATATIGVLVVVLQLRGQAKNAIASNRHNEAIKLKKEIYERIESSVTEAGNAMNALSSYINGFLRSVRLAQATEGPRMVLPGETVEELHKLEGAFKEKIEQVQAAIYRWHIVDLRITIFRLAFKVIQADLLMAANDYTVVAARLMSRGKDAWHLPPAEDVKELISVTDKYIAVVTGMDTTLQDFGNEMQNLLLGEMFRQQIPPMLQDNSNPYPRITLDAFRVASGFYSAKEDPLTQSPRKELADYKVPLSPPPA
jgi:hypothetical protein